MAREKLGARKSSFINANVEDRLNGDEFRLGRQAFDTLEAGSGGIEPSPGPNTDAISLTNGVAYTQNFDTLPSTGTAHTALPTDWFFSETGSLANTQFSAGTGSSGTGDTYSFGVAGVNVVTERALGNLGSGNMVPVFGASFSNASGATITELLISYIGELWRLGEITGRQDRLDFQYSLNATSLTTGTWVDVNQLDFATPNTTGVVGARDGNSSGN